MAKIDKTSRNRFNEIIVVAKNHNLGKLLKATSSDDPADEIDASDLRYALEELGPAFIKLGQLLATRPDMVGNEIADDLNISQAQVSRIEKSAIHSLKKLLK